MGVEKTIIRKSSLSFIKKIMKNRLITKISKFGSYLKFSEILFGVMYWLLSVLTILFVMFMIDNLLALPSGLRLPLSIAGIIFMSLLFFKRIFIPVKKKRSIERTALALEDKFKIPDNILINSCQLSQKEFSGATKSIVDKTINSSESMISNKKFFEKKEVKRLMKWLGGVAAAVILWLLYIVFFPHYAVNALNRYILPMKDLPPASSISLTILPEDNVVIFEGDNVKVNCSFDSLPARSISRSAGVELEQQREKQYTTNFNPSIVWKEGKEHIPPVQNAGKPINMKPIPETTSSFVHLFSNVKRTFSFRVFGGGTYSKSIMVSVIPRPKITKSRFAVKPPDYTAGQIENKPGPPASLHCLPESNVKINIELDNPVQSLSWQVGNSTTAFKGAGKLWSLEGLVAVPGQYMVEMLERKSSKKIQLCEGEIAIIKDTPPEIDFLTDNRNRLVNPGTKLLLDIQATDDYGIRNIAVTYRTVDQQNSDAENLRSWDYLGPPGKPGPIKETFKIILEPSIFLPGNTYLFQAACRDFSPVLHFGASKPLIVRIKSIGEVGVSKSDPLSLAVNLLKETIKQQIKANAIADNVKIYIDDILQKKSISKHAATMKQQQKYAFEAGRKTIKEFKKSPYGKSYVGEMTSLVEGEMMLVLNDIADLRQPKKAKKNMTPITKRQKYIIKELILLLGEIAEKSKHNTAPVKKDEGIVEAEEDDGIAESMAKSMKNDLEDYVKDQKKILDISKQLRDKDPEDLTDEEEDILGELAREQSKWAKLFEEKLTDWSKLADQDFSDGSIAQEFNEVFQEVKLAEKSLYEKKVDIAVPHEQSGIESAEKLIHNLEKWLPDTPDYQKWSMEDPENPLDLPLAELPDELEDIFGELMDSEEEMTEDVEDVTSQWMDSLDKGAGWDAADGPISNMSAKGVTGNRLPNKNEVGGRSGEGRTGRSNGQMVEATAQGKKGRQTPTRLTPSPFETGSIEDTSKEATGGSTGGGKLSGFTDEGLRGPVPPAIKQQMARLAGNQSKIRQQAEQMALRLSAHNLPSGDLESAIIQMKDFENAAKQANGQAIKKTYSKILDHLKQADNSIKRESALRKERIKLPKRARNDIMKSLRHGIPKGYEGMIGEYFKALASEKKNK
jgi:hypothetical protein